MELREPVPVLVPDVDCINAEICHQNDHTTWPIRRIYEPAAAGIFAFMHVIIIIMHASSLVHSQHIVTTVESTNLFIN